jgi:hypothetical protein
MPAQISELCSVLKAELPQAKILLNRGHTVSNGNGMIARTEIAGCVKPANVQTKIIAQLDKADIKPLVLLCKKVIPL